jgi:hypothetical protein
MSQGRNHFLVRTIVSFAIFACAGCMIPYSGPLRSQVRKDYLNRSALLQRDCLLVEYVGNGPESLLSLYDNQGRPTQYVAFELYWIFRLFRGPDYRVGSEQFFDVSRFPSRLYYLSTNVNNSYTRTLGPIDHPEQQVVVGPLAKYPLAKGTTVFVRKFHSEWFGGDSFSPVVEQLDVVLSVTIPDSTNRVDALCSVDQFVKIVEPQP